MRIHTAFIFVFSSVLLLPHLTEARQWQVVARYQGQTRTEACLVNVGAPCGKEIAMVYPFYLLDDGHGTRFLIDAGLSRWTGRLVRQKIPPLEAALIPVEQTSWTGRDLKTLGLTTTDITAVLITHSHWDHAAGLMDLDQVPVWLSPAEEKWIQAQPIPYGKGVIPQLYIDHPTRTYRWKRTPLSRWFGKTTDLSGDGSLLAVRLPGHTPGSTGYLVRTPQGTLFFIGDLLYRWYRDVTDSARGPLLSGFVDWNQRVEAHTLGQLAAFVTAFPDIRIVPQHDAQLLHDLGAKY